MAGTIKALQVPTAVENTQPELSESTVQLENLLRRLSAYCQMMHTDIAIY